MAAQVYTKTRGFTTVDPAMDRGGTPSFLRQIDKVKEGARIEQAAAVYGEFRMVANGQMLGRCVSPRHEDKTPSMRIYADEQRFYCFGIGCEEHGDVLDLVRLAEGCELWEAMMILARRYGISLPERPRSWYRRQERQRPVRDALEAERIEHVRDLLFRLVWMPWLRGLPDATRDEATRRAWKEALPLARMLYAERRGG